MTLLESITLAAAEADGGSSGGILAPLPKFPIVLNPDEVLRRWKTEIDGLTSDSPIKLVSGWKISETDTEVAELSRHFVEKLKSKLKNPRSLDKGEFLVLLKSFFKKSAKKIGLPINSVLSDPSGEHFAVAGIEKLGFFIVREVAGLIANCCHVLELWDVLEALIVHGNLRHLNSFSLVEKLVEKKQSELLCLFIKHVVDMSSVELLTVLKYFLSPTEDSYSSMMAVKQQWEKQALLAIEKATQIGLQEKVSNLAREASILLMMANDGFSSPELCLHYVFGSSNPDGLVLASAISKLDGLEVLGLIRYFMKWLKKYERFPDAGPCPSAGSVLGLKACESVPSLKSVVTGLGLVLDEHFSYLVLNPEFHDEMRVAEKVVNSLAAEANLCLPLGDLTKHLQSEVRMK